MKAAKEIESLLKVVMRNRVLLSVGIGTIILILNKEMNLLNWFVFKLRLIKRFSPTEC